MNFFQLYLKEDVINLANFKIIDKQKLICTVRLLKIFIEGNPNGI